MDFWENLDPNVKRYLIVVVVLIAGVLAFRSCASPDEDAPPPPRGIAK